MESYIAIGFVLAIPFALGWYVRGHYENLKTKVKAWVENVAHKAAEKLAYDEAYLKEAVKAEIAKAKTSIEKHI